MLTHKCDTCDSTGYAEPGGHAFKARMASLTPHTPDADPAPEPKPVPVPAAKSGGFDMSKL